MGEKAAGFSILLSSLTRPPVPSRRGVRTTRGYPCVSRAGVKICQVEGSRHAQVYELRCCQGSHFLRPLRLQFHDLDPVHLVLDVRDSHRCPGKGAAAGVAGQGRGLRFQIVVAGGWYQADGDPILIGLLDDPDGDETRSVRFVRWTLSSTGKLLTGMGSSKA